METPHLQTITGCKPVYLVTEAGGSHIQAQVQQVSETLSYNKKAGSTSVVERFPKFGKILGSIAYILEGGEEGCWKE